MTSAPFSLINHTFFGRFSCFCQSVSPHLLLLHNLGSFVLLETAKESESLQNCPIVWFPTSLKTPSPGGGVWGGLRASVDSPRCRGQLMNVDNWKSPIKVKVKLLRWRLQVRSL